MNNRRFLNYIVITSLIAVISLSCFSIFYLSPSFKNLVISNAESDAIKIGRHLSGPFQDLDEITRQLPPDFAGMAEKATTDFGIMKIKVFDALGETVYSTSASDIGVINERDYFHNIVAAGDTFTKMVKKDTRSLEGQIVSADVVETYVPILHGNNVIGAFELYYNITDSKKAVDKLLYRSNGLLLLLAAVLLLVVFLISLIARRGFIKQRFAEKKIIEQSRNLKTSEAELNAIIDNSALGITISDVGGKILRINPAHKKIFGYDLVELNSMTFSDFTYPDDVGKHQALYERMISGEIDHFNMQKRFIHKDGHLVWTQVTVSAVPGKNKRPRLIIGMVEDITQRKLIEIERVDLIRELQIALDEIKTLRGIIPICMYCKKIKGDEDAWEQLEQYIKEHSEADFTHGCCPDCYKKQLEEIRGMKKDGENNLN